jgi:hypothetical protein
MNTMTRLMNRVLPSCKDVSSLTSQAMDESLSLSKRLGLLMHLGMCVWCRRNAEQLRLMRDLAHGRAQSENRQAELSSDARKRIAQSLKQHDDPS